MPSRPPFARLISRIRRRLTVQVWLEWAPWTIVGALAMAGLWFLIQPRLGVDTDPIGRWDIALSLLGMALIVAGAGSLVYRPNREETAFNLDQRWGLKERIATAYLLTKEQHESPAGIALLADVDRRVSDLNAASRFPIRIPKTIALVPLGALALGLIAYFVDPFLPPRPAENESDEALAQNLKADLDKEIQMLAAKKNKPKPENLKNGKIEEIDEDLEKLINQPRATNDQLKDRLKDLTEIEDKIKDEQRKQDDKAAAINEQLQQMDRLSKKDKKSQDGPGKDAENALNQGDLKKAEEEMDRLSKKLKDKELSDKEKEQLQNQLEDIQNKLQRLSREDEDFEKEAERLKELSRKGEIDPETLDRELDQLQKNHDKLDRETEENLKEASDLLKQAERDLQEGKDEEAAEKIKQAAEKMGQQGDEESGRQMAEQLVRVQRMKRAMAQGLGRSDKGRGRRPETKEGEIQALDTKVNGPLNTKGKMAVTGAATGNSFKKKSSAEMVGEIHQASQDAPEAIDRQRLPRSATDLTKGYFENLGGQKQPKKDK